MNTLLDLSTLCLTVKLPNLVCFEEEKQSSDSLCSMTKDPLGGKLLNDEFVCPSFGRFPRVAIVLKYNSTGYTMYCETCSKFNLVGACFV